MNVIHLKCIHQSKSRGITMFKALHLICLIHKGTKFEEILIFHAIFFGIVNSILDLAIERLNKYIRN